MNVAAVPKYLPRHPIWAVADGGIQYNDITQAKEGIYDKHTFTVIRRELSAPVLQHENDCKRHCISHSD